MLVLCNMYSVTTGNGCEDADIVQLLLDCDAATTTIAITTSPPDVLPTIVQPHMTTTIQPIVSTAANQGGSSNRFTPGPRVLVVIFRGDLNTLSSSQRENLIAQIKAGIAARSSGKFSASDLIVLLRSGSINAEIQFRQGTPNSDIAVLASSIQATPL